MPGTDTSTEGDASAHGAASADEDASADEGASDAGDASAEEAGAANEIADAPEGCLTGVRIVDFSRILAGPLATMVLGDLGADVVKIERPGSGDDTRSWGPPVDAAGTPTYFLAVNRNKGSIVLDLSSEGGVAEAQRLVDTADVVVENFRPGVMNRLGLGADALRARNPRLVYCSISAFGSGAGADLPGFDLIVQAVGGLMSITGEPDGEPQKAGVALVDVIAGLFATIGILGALRLRDRTGEGQVVEVDLLTSLLAALVNQSSAFTAAGVVAGRMGNRHPSIAPYEVLQTGDGQIAVAVGNERQFAALCRVLGDPDLATDARFADNSSRVANRSELCGSLTGLLALDGTGEWVAALSEAGVPAGPVNDIAEAFALAESLGLEPTVEMHRPDHTTVTLPRNPIRLSATPITYRLSPPPLGGETAERLAGY